MPLLAVRSTANPYTTRMFETNICACPSCWDEKSQTDLSNVLYGPHDLNCICPSCLVHQKNFSTKKMQKMFNIRYPPHVMKQYSSSIDEILEHLSIASAQSRLESGYTPPPNSPTNREMHAYNGNHGHQHDNGSASFLRAAARGLRPGATEPERFAAGTTALTSLVGGGLAHAGFKDLGRPLNELREQIFGRVGPSDKDKTRNFKTKDWSGLKPFPIGTVKAHPTTTPPDKKPPMQHHPDLSQPSMPDGVNPNRLDPDMKDEDYYGGFPQLRPGHKQPTNTPTMSPTNKDMHSYNGNINPRPYTKNVAIKMAKKAAKRKIKRAARKTAKKAVNANFRKLQTIAKAGHIKGEKQAAKENNKERNLARRYTRLLKMPSLAGLRLGSTGNNPTKLMHGYYEQTFSMNAPGFGTNGAIAATDMIFFLSPKVFTAYTNATTFYAPLALGAAVNSQLAFNNAANTTFTAFDYANSTAMKNESGCTTSSSMVPLARLVAAHVSIICRCPIATTAPPFLYAGLLPSNVATINGTTVDKASQLNAFTSTQIRSLKSTKELNSMEGSCVYIPGSAKNLDFSPNVFSYDSTSIMDNSPIPYIGMSGCPTTANVTIMASAWFELQQTANNMAYSGWTLGPKVSTEDVFDFIPRFVPYSEKAKPLGTKGNGSSSAETMAQLYNYIRPPPPTAEQQIAELKQQLDLVNAGFKALTVDVNTDSDDDFKEPKYECDTCSPPSSYKNLSKSTIDLALSIKEKLTPGSVTSKTVRSSLP